MSDQQERVRSLDEYYTTIRQKMRETGLSHSEAEQLVQRENLEVLDRFERENPDAVQEFRSEFPEEAARWNDTVGKKLEAYRAEKRAERSQRLFKERYQQQHHQHQHFG